MNHWALWFFSLHFFFLFRTFCHRMRLRFLNFALTNQITTKYPLAFVCRRFENVQRVWKRPATTNRIGKTRRIGNPWCRKRWSTTERVMCANIKVKSFFIFGMQFFFFSSFPHSLCVCPENVWTFLGLMPYTSHILVYTKLKHIAFNFLCWICFCHLCFHKHSLMFIDRIYPFCLAAEREFIHVFSAFESRQCASV